MITVVGNDRFTLPTPPLLMNKKDLATLIDAYADAKASRNQHLVNSMVAQLEQALDGLFADAGDEPEDTTSGSEF